MKGQTHALRAQSLRLFEKELVEEDRRRAVDDRFEHVEVLVDLLFVRNRRRDECGHGLCKQ